MMDDETLRADFAAMVRAVERCTRPWRLAAVVLAAVAAGLAVALVCKI